MKHLPTIGLTLAALLLSSCAKLDAIFPPRENTAKGSAVTTKARGWWLIPGETDALPPLVDTQGYNPLAMPNKKAADYANPFPKGSYEHFAAQKAYPVIPQVYTDEQLLSYITATNSKIIICLPQQRARLYVYGRVAMDWPISTGTNGHETPTGVFRIIEKSRDHHSSRYGKWLVDNKVVNSNADLTKGPSHEGAVFVPSAMPNWNRLTWDGVGIHGGRVVPGRRLSHGCIRTPYATAKKLFQHTLMGMPVYITRAVEDYNRGGMVRPIDVKYRPNGPVADDDPDTDAAPTPQPA